MTEHRTVLVVDDDTTARDTIKALLHADPYQLEFAASGAEALARMAAGAVDLLLCDVMMPGMDGFEVCRAIKAHPEWRFVPIILVTALDGSDDMVRGIEAGADDFLTKPVERVVLRARTRAMLRVRERFTQLRGAAADVDTLLAERRHRIVTNAGLTDRERHVLDLLLLGRTHEDIGIALDISARTAKYHQSSILKKLGADSRMDLMRIFL